MPSAVQPPRRPSVDTLFSVNPDGSHNVIHTADVHGRFQVRKRVIWTLLVVLYLALPWVLIGGHPAVLIDIERRAFYCFGQTFNAQDFPLAFFFLTGIGFTLIVASALFGRAWCGYACPQTVFLEGLYRRVERWIEGGATQRQRLQKAPWTAGKLLRRGLKLTVFAGVSFWLAHSFLAYFMPIRELHAALLRPPAEHPFAFGFVLFFSAVCFGNFGFFREQLCLIICPYGRLQGVLADKDTIVVGYDKARGEPRGKGAAHGACVDCFRCVTVCPTGIDIRNGTQFECIGCANCIDACDEVMDRLGRPRGLVRYDSMRGFEDGKRRFLRPRLAVYALLFAVGVGVFATMALQRTAFEANLMRPSGSPYLLENGMLRNQLLLHLVNKTPEPQRFVLQEQGPAGAEFVIATREVLLESLSDQRVPVFVTLPRSSYVVGTKIEILVRGAGAEHRARIEFLGPR